MPSDVTIHTRAVIAHSDINWNLKLHIGALVEDSLKTGTHCACLGIVLTAGIGGTDQASSKLTTNRTGTFQS